MAARTVTVRDAMLFFEKAPVAMMVVENATRRVVAFNEKAIRLLGHPDPGVPLSKLLPAVELRRFADAIPGRAEAAEVERSRIIVSGGSVRAVDLSLSRLPAEDMVVVAIHDSPVAGVDGERLRQSQKMEALGMLAGGIAHDFNNLLTIISGYSQMLQTSQRANDVDRGALDEVLKACEHAAGLTAQLLAFSRRQPVQPQIIDMNRLLDETAVLLRRLIGEQIDLRILPDPGAGCIHADPGQIRQVILNLAINGRDAMPHGGSLTIQTRRSDTGGANPTTQTVLEFTDTGAGMDETTRSHLFEPFFTTKPPGKGTGIGLATVHRIVKHLGGSIEVASEPGRGATFRVSLPRVEDRAPEKETAQTAASESPGGHETILLVEDDDGVRALTCQVLQRSGYRVIAASDGAEAVKAELAFEDPIALLITDLVMPGMSGSALAGLLRERRPGLAVMFISGYPDDITGDDAFLRKPFAPAGLAAKVREVLDHVRNRQSNGSIAAGGC